MIYINYHWSRHNVRDQLLGMQTGLTSWLSHLKWSRIEVDTINDNKVDPSEYKDTLRSNGTTFQPMTLDRRLATYVAIACQKVDNFFMKTSSIPPLIQKHSNLNFSIQSLETNLQSRSAVSLRYGMYGYHCPVSWIDDGLLVPINTNFNASHENTPDNNGKAACVVEVDNELYCFRGHVQQMKFLKQPWRYLGGLHALGDVCVQDIFETSSDCSDCFQTRNIPVP